MTLGDDCLSRETQLKTSIWLHHSSSSSFKGAIASGFWGAFWPLDNSNDSMCVLARWRSSSPPGILSTADVRSLMNLFISSLKSAFCFSTRRIVCWQKRTGLVWRANDAVNTGCAWLLKFHRESIKQSTGAMIAYDTLPCHLSYNFLKSPTR